MAKIYNGSVSIIKNTKDVITIEADPDGKFTAANVDELYKTMLALGEKHKLECKFYIPDIGGNTPVLQVKFGKPYVTLFLASKAPGAVTTTRPTKIKLA